MEEKYKGIKLIIYAIKIWERVVEARLRREVRIGEEKYGMKEERYYRCNICFENVDGGVQRRSGEGHEY